jgi:hypothetical protein
MPEDTKDATPEDPPVDAPLPPGVPDGSPDVKVVNKAEMPRKSDYIVKTTRYTDNHGRILYENEVVHGDEPEDFNRFTGTINLTMETPVGPSNESIPFAVPASNTIVEAYERIEHAITAAVGKRAREIEQEIKEAIAQPRLVGSNGAPLSDPRKRGRNSKLDNRF